MSGFDANQTSLGGKKAKMLQPPQNASPGELRLWRKLNGFLTDEEKQIDSLEHNKAKSRANLAGRPRTATPPRRPSAGGDAPAAAPLYNPPPPAALRRKSPSVSQALWHDVKTPRLIMITVAAYKCHLGPRLA